jgi:small subunit ribosomal protein S24e
MSYRKNMKALSFQLITTYDRSNVLLGRRELRISMVNAAGKLSKLELISSLEKKLGINKEKIYPIYLRSEKGKNNIDALVYIYENKESANKHLPKYRILRRLAKDERKRIIADEKAAKLKAKQANKADSK